MNHAHRRFVWCSVGGCRRCFVQALSKHIAHLFSRDPLVIFEGRIEEVDDEEEVR